MKLSEVNKIIKCKDSCGFLVHFKWFAKKTIIKDYFPDIKKGEQPFKTIDEAIEKGRKFAEATKGDTCNFYIIKASDFTPVGNWKLSNR